jgi:hypothetical protein
VGKCVNQAGRATPHRPRYSAYRAQTFMARNSAAISRRQRWIERKLPGWRETGKSLEPALRGTAFVSLYNESFRITKLDAQSMMAEPSLPDLCSRQTLTFDRVAKAVTFVRTKIKVRAGLARARSGLTSAEPLEHESDEGGRGAKGTHPPLPRPLEGTPGLTTGSSLPRVGRLEIFVWCSETGALSKPPLGKSGSRPPGHPCG